MSSPRDGVTERAYLSGRVQRYSTWPTHYPQSVGDHCWAVALIYEQIFGPPRAEVERYIRYHDSAELIVGDPPFPVKANNPDLKAAYDRIEPEALERMGISIPEITPEEKLKVKISDLLEMTAFGMTEEEMGNRLAAPITRRTSSKALEVATALSDNEDKRRVMNWLFVEQKRHHRVMTGYIGAE